MIQGINAVVGWFGTCLNFILNLELPNGNNTIKLKSIFIFLILCNLAWQIIKMFLSKGHMEKSNGKD